MVHGASARAFRTWHRATVQHERMKKRARFDAAAIVIQRLARSYLYRQQGRSFLLAFARKKMRERRAIARVEKHERARRAVRAHWRAARRAEYREYRAAFVVQKAFRNKQGRSLLAARIKARKEREERARAALIRWAVAAISRFWLAVSNNIALRARYVARKAEAARAKDEERRAREKAAREAEEAELRRQVRSKHD